MIVEKFKSIIPMKDFLASINRTAVFTSPVFHAKLESSEKDWVLKLPELGIKELAAIIAESAAYEFSESMGLNLVPEAKIVNHNQTIGSLKEFINSTELNWNAFQILLSHEGNDDIRYLKLFWFILGIWDTTRHNVLLACDNRLLAVDNDSMAEFQRVYSYGSHHFTRAFKVCLENTGSITDPIIVEGTGVEVLGILDQEFGNDLPVFRRAALGKKCNYSMAFSYFIESNIVWEEQNHDGARLNYFTENVTKSSLERFHNIDCVVFNDLINEVVVEINDVQLLELQLTRSELSTTLEEHFGIICDGIKERYQLVADYINFRDEL